MKTVVVLLVFALSQISGYTMGDGAELGVIAYELPTRITNKFTIMLNGTLDRTQRTFSAGLVLYAGGVGGVGGVGGAGGEQHCKLVYNFHSSYLQVTSSGGAGGAGGGTHYYSANASDTDFNLKLGATSFDDNKYIISLCFELSSGGTCQLQDCIVKSTGADADADADAGYIVFKEGVTKVNTLRFYLA